MDYSLTGPQQKLKQETAEFARAALNADLVRRDQEQHFNLDGWRQCGALGLMALPVPEQWGGGGADAVTAVAALEGLGYGCRDNGLWFAINAHLWGCTIPLLAFGSDAQRRHFLPRLCSGEWIGALAISERDAGSDAYSLKTLARREGDAYVLNGSKMFVTNGPVADMMVVLATVDPDKGARGITAFLVERGTPGLEQGQAIAKMGLRTVPMGELHLRDCRVAATQRLGEEGNGFGIFAHAMEWERGLILAGAVGAMQYLLERSRQYARGRRQFGKPIGGFQLVSTKIVDMQMRLETSRLLLYKVAALKAELRPAILEAAMAKLHISEAWVQTCQDALQVHGGYGYLTETELERELRDALASRLYSGTSEIQRQIIAQWLGM